MKKNKDIQFFDYVIINSKLILKTYNKDSGYRFYDENGPAGYPGRDKRVIYNKSHRDILFTIIQTIFYGLGWKNWL